jgi:glucokinase
MGTRGGIDLGGTKILAVLVDETGQVRGQSRRPTPAADGPAVVAAHLAEAIRDAAVAAAVEVADLEGIGIGAPGVVDARAGTVAHSGNIAGWEAPFPLASVVSEALGRPVYLGNDVGVAVLGEAKLGACRPYRSFLGVWWGTGVGGGVILDQKRWVGRGNAGEFGHMVIRRNGALCPCGRRGCVEAYAGRRSMELRARALARKGEKTALFRIMEKRGVDRLTSGVWARALAREDKLAVRLVNRAVEAIACGAASVVNLLDLEAIVVGGGLGTRLGQEYADRIAEAMKPHLFVPERPPVVHVAALGDYAGAIGATLLVAQPDKPRRPRGKPGGDALAAA